MLDCGSLVGFDEGGPALALCRPAQQVKRSFSASPTGSQAASNPFSQIFSVALYRPTMNRPVRISMLGLYLLTTQL